MSAPLDEGDAGTSTPAAADEQSMSAGPVMIDTSLWIEALRRCGSASARRVVAQAVEPGMALVNGLILTELLKGARDDGEFRRLELLLEATTCLPVDRSTWDRAARLGFDLRRGGVSVPTVDLAIAASALQAGVPLLHADTHFELIAARCDLRQVLINDSTRADPGTRQG